MTTANLTRCHRQEKIYSRARNRADLIRAVDEEYTDEFEFPIAQLEPDTTASLAQLMTVDVGNSSPDPG